MDGADFLSVLLIALGLSADCFAVALGSSASIRSYSKTLAVRVAIAFGLFQALMPVIGWLAGQTIVEFIADYDHFVAFALLAFIGGRMIWGSVRSENENNKSTDINKWSVLLTLALATSIDALAVGLSLAFLRVHIAIASVTIGLVAFVITIIGFLLGKKVGKLIGKRAELVGGIVLIAIGLRILISHLLD